VLIQFSSFGRFRVTRRIDGEGKDIKAFLTVGGGVVNRGWVIWVGCLEDENRARCAREDVVPELRLRHALMRLTMYKYKMVSYKVLCTGILNI
jgi:hypothetical protein